MSKTSRRNKNLYQAFRVVVVLLLVGGFTYQTLEFLFLYWTYPTVVDIQQSSPFYLEVPAFTFCNKIGYNFHSICHDFGAMPCVNSLFSTFMSDVLCKQYPQGCFNNSLPKDFQAIFYGKFTQRYSITKNDYKRIAIPLEEYLNCTIEFAGKLQNCNLENVLGSFYSTNELPQFCYTIYSLWGTPDKEREKIPKGSKHNGCCPSSSPVRLVTSQAVPTTSPPLTTNSKTMRFHIFLNSTRRPLEDYINSTDWVGPRHNPPSDANVQIGVHNPYFLPSPYFEGSSFLGGRAYELRLKQSESHLLPLPYQTNCTDYMTTWRQRDGKAPINQLGVIQECRLNRTLEALGCIPLDFDYPHTYNICKTCEKKVNCPYKEPPNNCTRLADSYNQPCDSMTYLVNKEDKVITVFKQIKSKWTHESDGIRVSMAHHDCDGIKVWTLECSTIEIEVPFDRFEITNITYNPKFESLELFSVIGGYMGMWLGISLLAIFDMFADVFVFVKSYMAKRKSKKLRAMKSKFPRDSRIRMERQSATAYNVW